MGKSGLGDGLRYQCVGTLLIYRFRLDLCVALGVGVGVRVGSII